MKRYHAIFLDATNTLIYPYPSVGEVYSQIGRAHGYDISQDELTAAFKALWREEQKKRIDFTSRFGVTEADEREWWRRFAKGAFKRAGGRECSDECFEDLYDCFACGSSWRLFPEVEEVLRELSERGYVVGVISNFDSRLTKICRDLGLEDAVDFTLISGVFGFEKPDARIFAEGVRLAGTSASMCLHIGDDYTADFVGAKEAGLDALFLVRNGNPYEEEAGCRAASNETVADLRGIFAFLDTPLVRECGKGVEDNGRQS